MSGPEELTQKAPSLGELRERLAKTRGRDYWRGLEELADSAAFEQILRHALPRQADMWIDAVSRRRFLKLMGASLALAGLGACGRAAPVDKKIVPYVKQPENWIPGKPLFFATAFSHHGAATGVIVESHEGRPTKIEGNPDHPASRGATDAFAQASILSFYDPDRSQVITNAGAVSTWGAFFNALNSELEGQRLNGGNGLRILTETIVSPTLGQQLRSLLDKFPGAKWHQYEPANRDSMMAGARLAFGEPVETRYHFDQSKVILSLDADFLFYGRGSVRYARDFSDRRRVRTERAEMNRLYAVESTPTLTGAMADHRRALRPAEIGDFTRALAARVGIVADEPTTIAPVLNRWLEVVARDLAKHRGASLVVAGEQQPPLIHALAHALNDTLGNVGKTVSYSTPIEAEVVDQLSSLRDLAGAIENGDVALLIIVGGNPVFTAPAELRFGGLLSRVGFSVHLGMYEDETSARCHWHIPEAHYLETWSDSRAYDGTASIVQPLIAPLYGGKSAHELIAALMGQPGAASYNLVRDSWARQRGTKDFEIFWRKALHDGFVDGSAFPAKNLKLKKFSLADQTPAAAIRLKRSDASAASENLLEIIFRPDPTIYDGRYANNGWLQELPKPLTKLTWDNALLISPATATRLGITQRVGATGGEHGTIFANLVELRLDGRVLRAPAWITPGHADDCATLYFGYGRSRAGKVGTATGVNAYALRSTKAFWFGRGLEIRKLDIEFPLACTQFHHNMEGRALVRAAPLERYRREPDFAADEKKATPPSLYPPQKYDGYAWGMVIDTNACIGCNACVIACQAENNIPIVGKNEVGRGREMHWIRVDRYYQGDPARPEVLHQPVPCMQCENAPCELVCPVGATNHSDEGLNDMVYNRCVGTRYCSNNCPYKVRRFNFLQYSDFETASLKLLRNPNVTVRTRGVMEKCTYCVQRINAGKIAAEKENRVVSDGEIVTACQAACPTQAIVFGNLNDAESGVARLKASPLNYGLLTELNTRPRTTYLAKLKNFNSDLEDEPSHG